jgi:hypothetical protein
MSPFRENQEMHEVPALCLKNEASVISTDPLRASPTPDRRGGMFPNPSGPRKPVPEKRSSLNLTFLGAYRNEFPPNNVAVALACPA